MRQLADLAGRRIRLTTSGLTQFFRDRYMDARNAAQQAVTVVGNTLVRTNVGGPQSRGVFRRGRRRSPSAIRVEQYVQAQRQRARDAQARATRDARARRDQRVSLARAVARGSLARNPLLTILASDVGRQGVAAGERGFWRERMAGKHGELGRIDDPGKRGRTTPRTSPQQPNAVPSPAPARRESAPAAPTEFPGNPSTKPVPAPSRAPTPGRQPEQLPTPGTVVVPRPSPAPRTNPRPVANPWPVRLPGASPGWLPWRMPVAFPMPVSFPIPRAVPLPRATPRAPTTPRAVPLMPPVSGVPTGGISVPLQVPGLTPLNPGVLTFSPPQPVPQEELDRCKCPPKKRKQREKGCTNPLVSRTVRDGFIITKRKLLCQPSKSRRPSVRALPTPTSSAGALSNILGVGLPSPWG